MTKVGVNQTFQVKSSCEADQVTVKSRKLPKSGRSSAKSCRDLNDLTWMIWLYVAYCSTLILGLLSWKQAEGKWIYGRVSFYSFEKLELLFIAYFVPATQKQNVLLIF